MPIKSEIPFRERTRPLVDNSDITLKNKNDKKMSPYLYRLTHQQDPALIFVSNPLFDRTPHLRAGNARLSDENNVLLF